MPASGRAHAWVGIVAVVSAERGVTACTARAGDARTLARLVAEVVGLLAIAMVRTVLAVGRIAHSAVSHAFPFRIAEMGLEGRAAGAARTAAAAVAGGTDGA